jgi:hypothetical protein
MKVEGMDVRFSPPFTIIFPHLPIFNPNRSVSGPYAKEAPQAFFAAVVCPAALYYGVCFDSHRGRGRDRAGALLSLKEVIANPTVVD